MSKSKYLIFIIPIIAIAIIAIYASGIRKQEPDRYICESFTSAIKNGDTQKLNNLLNRYKKDQLFEYKDVNGNKVIVYAFAIADQKVIDVLLHHGLTPTDALRAAYTVKYTWPDISDIPFASKFQLILDKNIKYFLVIGADPNVPDKDGITAQQMKDTYLGTQYQQPYDQPSNPVPIPPSNTNNNPPNYPY